MIPKINSINLSNSYKTNYSTICCAAPSFLSNPDSFVKKVGGETPTTLSEAISKVVSNLAEKISLPGFNGPERLLLKDPDPSSSGIILQDMYLSAKTRQVGDDARVMLRLTYGMKNEGGFIILEDSSKDEVLQRMNTPEFKKELEATIKETSDGELFPKDYHDSLIL